MDDNLIKAFAAGSERVAAWAELLDRINVFPVPDGDTGRNLALSLYPLRNMGHDTDYVEQRLLLAARGNSGNIASRFFTALIYSETILDLLSAIKKGCDLARQGIAEPENGTILDVFDALCREFTDNFTPDKTSDSSGLDIGKTIQALELAVKNTTNRLEALRDAHVVDSGALGMYIFFEAFLITAFADTAPGSEVNIKPDIMLRPVVETFRGFLEPKTFDSAGEKGFCVDFVVEKTGDQIEESLGTHGESVVLAEKDGLVKIHLHTDDREELRKKAESMGRIVSWADDSIESQVREFGNDFGKNRPTRIMTDAAGSLTRAQAARAGITLLDSYITAGETSLPETLCDSAQIYSLLQSRVKVTTSQASVFEREQIYQGMLEQYENVLYICVGTAFTGNYTTVEQWKKQNNVPKTFAVVDSHAASGRLGLMALATARFADTASTAGDVLDYAYRAREDCQELVFIDRLKYLARSGRLSHTGAFFGDMLKKKPAVSPQKDGAVKMGLFKSREAQLEFALDNLDAREKSSGSLLVMLEYSNNQEWVEGTVRPAVEKLLPDSELLLNPLSLTTGVHAGPGTWGVASIPI